MCHSSFQCEPTAIYKMKSSKSALSSRVMKQIDFVLVVSEELEIFLWYFSSRIEARKV